MEQQQQWTTAAGRLTGASIEQILANVIAIEKAAGHSITICVGTDSLVKGSEIHFATTVVLVRKGAGGRMFTTTQQVTQTMGVKARMLAEVNQTIEVAYQLAPLLEKLQVPMEVHADINSDAQNKSYAAYKDAVGYFNGMGYVFKMKPDAFASSACADRML